MSDRPWYVRPAPDEYAPFYAGYIARVPEDDVLAALESQIESRVGLLRGVPEARADHRYAAGKWSIRQVAGHLIDAERVFAYRALRFARADATPLAGFAEDEEAPMFGYNITTLIIILAIALLLFGPRRLPELGDSIGKAIRSFKKAHEDPDAAKAQAEIPPSATTAPQTAACPQCHKEVGGDFAFCPHCGGKMNKA